MIKAIIFDCFGVLATDIWLVFLEQLPPTADRQAARDLNMAYDRGMVSRQQFVEGVMTATGQMPPDIGRLSAGQLGKNSALLEYIKVLRPAYKIGLLSNISSNWITDELLTAEDQLLFDDMVFSHKVGMTKPDPRIFQLACNRLSVLPEEAIMIDDREDYIAAASSVGMKGLAYSGFALFQADLQRLLNADE